jgi:hypothetical protein
MMRSNPSPPVPRIYTKDLKTTGEIAELAVNVDPMREIIFFGGEGDTPYGMAVEDAIALAGRLMDAAQIILDGRKNPVKQ